MNEFCLRHNFRWILPAALLLTLLFTSARASAELTRLEIQERRSFAKGRRFGNAGTYQWLIGRAHFAVDPSHRANRAVVDLKLAPRNKRGLVEYSTDVEILVPTDPSKANGTLLYDVNNRGRRMALRMFGGDHFLLRKGYVVVWCGWIAEILPLEDPNMPGNRLLRIDAPVATQQEKVITGLHRAEMVPDEATTVMNISNRDYVGSYEPTRAGLTKATLTHRLREADHRVAIPRDQWRIKVEHLSAAGQKHLLPKVSVEMTGGFKPGHIYELVYQAKHPVVQGLGLTSIRDLMSFLKYDNSRSNPASPITDRRAIGFGISQSGRCLRVLLYDGFNIDEQKRQVFDGLIPHVSGGGLGFFNHRFAAPTRYASQHTNHLFPCDMFPFTYSTQSDPVSGRKDGLLIKARADGVVPKIMHIQNSAEYWHRSGSLVHTDPLSKRDAKIPPEVRIYAVGGAQHSFGDGFVKPPTITALPENPTDYRPLLRGLLTALDDWIREGKEPPPSVYPTIADGTLVDWRKGNSGWRPLPGVTYPSVIQQPEWLDYGPRFQQHRILDNHPPKRLGKYPVLVPAYDADNNERGMLKLPSISVPVATYTGWNLRAAKVGASTELMKLKGALIPFARDKQWRQANGDPRPALLERYRDFDDYLRRYEAAARRLARQRYILPEEVQELVSRSRQNRKWFENKQK